MRPDRFLKTSAFLLLGVFAFTTAGLRIKADASLLPLGKLIVIELSGSPLVLEPYESLEKGVAKRGDRPAQNGKTFFIDCYSTLLFLEKGKVEWQCLSLATEKVFLDKVPLIIRLRRFMI